MNKRYTFITVLIFVIEVIIALFFKDSFIRAVFGDFLVVILIFSFVRIFYSGNGLDLAIAVLLFSFVIEFSQYFRLVEILGLEKYRWAQIVLGSTFDVWDLIAYTLGVTVSYFLDKNLFN